MYKAIEGKHEKVQLCCESNLGQLALATSALSYDCQTSVNPFFTLSLYNASGRYPHVLSKLLFGPTRNISLYEEKP